MRVFSSLAAARGQLSRSSIAVGNFDGVHLGHRRLLERAATLAHPRGGESVMLTFDPHPAKVLAPALAPPLICTTARKLELAAACGIDAAIVQPFDAAFAATPPDAFAAALFATGLSEVVVGYDFSYGRGRAGDVTTLREAAQTHGAAVERIGPVQTGGLVVSSTRVRGFITEGRVEAAAQLLGRPFDVDGKVVRGVGRGKKLGFPTANLAIENELVPGLGVYAVRVRIGMKGPSISGAANIGINPTFLPDVFPAVAPPPGSLLPSDSERGTHPPPPPSEAGLAPPPGSLLPSLASLARSPLQVEVHLIDYSGDLYGQTLRVEFIQRLRVERKFPSVDALREQIARDIDEARGLLT